MPVPIASMGDIAFLLIIFFLVCSEVSKDKNVDLELPLSENVEKLEKTVVARISIDKENQIWFDGDMVDSAKDVEWGIRALITGTVADEQRHVQFKCDAEATKEVFEPVLKAIAEAGAIIEAAGEEP